MFSPKPAQPPADQAGIGETEVDDSDEAIAAALAEEARLSGLKGQHRLRRCARALGRGARAYAAAHLVALVVSAPRALARPPAPTAAAASGARGAGTMSHAALAAQGKPGAQARSPGDACHSEPSEHTPAMQRADVIARALSAVQRCNQDYKRAVDGLVGNASDPFAETRAQVIMAMAAECYIPDRALRASQGAQAAEVPVQAPAEHAAGRESAVNAIAAAIVAAATASPPVRSRRRWDVPPSEEGAQDSDAPRQPLAPEHGGSALVMATAAEGVQIEDLGERLGEQAGMDCERRMWWACAHSACVGEGSDGD